MSIRKDELFIRNLTESQTSLKTILGKKKIFTTPNGLKSQRLASNKKLPDRQKKQKSTSHKAE